MIPPEKIQAYYTLLCLRAQLMAEPNVEPRPPRRLAPLSLRVRRVLAVIYDELRGRFS